MAHTPPACAEKKIDDAALAYLQAVQNALGTAHKESVLVVAVVGLFRVAKVFGIGFADRFVILRKVESAMAGIRSS